MLKRLSLFLPEIRDLLKEKKVQELRNLLKEIHSLDFVEEWDKFSPQEGILFFRLLPRQKAIEVFEDLDFPQQAALLKNLQNQEMAEILDEMAPDERADLFGELPERIRKKLFSVMKKEEVDNVRELLTYEEHTAGGLMTTEFVELRKEMTARAAILRLQQLQRLHKGEPIQTVYITDHDHKLLGEVLLNTLITAPPDMLIANLMSPVGLIKVNIHLDQEEVASIFTKYDLVNAPVVDNQNRLRGVITIDDVVDVIHQEATEDMAKLAGTSQSELVSKSALEIAKLRLPWLFISWGGGLFAAWIIGSFANVLSQVMALAFFMPIIAGMGGNVGTQSSTIVVRGMATGDVDIKRIGWMVFKELRVGLILGLSYGFLLGLVSYLRYGVKEYGPLCLVISFGICASMTIAATFGTFLPMLFKRINIDPAVATGPFITTFTDVVSMVVYFTLATLLLI